MDWLVLTHHLPPDPPYLRVKVGRRLAQIGAVALKNSVYVLPHSSEALEDFSWLRQEIEREGGEATIAEASFVDGVTDGRLLETFRAARREEYEEVAATARELLDEVRREGVGGGVDGKLKRLVGRLDHVRSIDFFEAPGRDTAEHAVQSLKEAHMGIGEVSSTTGDEVGDVGRGRTWVTREGVRVDRIASAWLIRRFIDPDAQFRFVPPQGYAHVDGELRFDMFEGEFTHVGEACTFETLMARFELGDPALVAVAEIVHDVDCKDDKYGRPEATGIGSIIDGLARADMEDEARLERGGALFDALFEHFRSES